MSSNNCCITDRESISKPQLGQLGERTRTRNSFIVIELLITIMMLAFLTGMLLPAQNTSDVNCINDASSNDINSVADRTVPVRN